MRSTFLILAAAALASALPKWREEQHPLHDGALTSFGNSCADEVIHELTLAEIIPTVISSFTPLLNISITWPHATASLGNTIKPKHLQTEPTVDLTPFSTTTSTVYSQVVLVLTDPDAKSRDNPIWAEFCHWIAYWPANSSSSSSSFSSTPQVSLDLETKQAQDPKAKTDVLPYAPPSPPKKTWKHRYVFLALTPLNGTTERLNLTAPSGRQRWGNEEARTGVRKWAGENGLGVVGGQFVYSKHKKQ
ncbi:OV-16 antigen [Elsinoe australis]|uniref:OV-16 antigen n=1 Tax=Elsinoe australis TaxID=40998 RepID=A0A2P7Z243_9PEZI|nr:OV-16 antigen [Elsinoe australis]